MFDWKLVKERTLAFDMPFSIIFVFVFVQLCTIYIFKNDYKQINMFHMNTSHTNRHVELSRKKFLLPQNIRFRSVYVQSLVYASCKYLWLIVLA